MSLSLYSALKTWRQTRRNHKTIDAASRRTLTPAPPAESIDAAVLAAGIACAGQVPEQPQRR